MFQQRRQKSQNKRVRYYQVTSSFTIPNWLQLSMQEYLIYKKQKKQNKQKKLNSQQKQQHQQQQQNQQQHEQYHQKQLQQQQQLLYYHIIILNGYITINFLNPYSIISLTKCILKVIFNIQWKLSIDNLCPRIPNRINYLIWIQKYVIEYDKKEKENGVKDEGNEEKNSQRNSQKGRQGITQRGNEKGRQKDKLHNQIQSSHNQQQRMNNANHHNHIVSRAHLSNLNSNNEPQNNKIVGIDIGTGASLIYPLLGCRLFDWDWYATQKDIKSIEHASKLIQINKLQHKITIINSNSNSPEKLQKDTQNKQSKIGQKLSYEIEQTQYQLQNQNLLTKISSSLQPHHQHITFLMCNPPFFDSYQQNQSPLSNMTQNEHNTSGGQYQFFFQLYIESFYHSSLIKYFTLMIGLGRDFFTIKQFLEKQLQYYQTLEWIRFGKLNQGNNTRFIVAWKVNENKTVTLGKRKCDIAFYLYE